MEKILNSLEKLGLIETWNLAVYNKSEVFYPESKLKIDKQLRLIALFTRGTIYLVKF